MFLRTMKIATRASLGFAVLALLVVLVGGFSLQQMKYMNNAAAEVKENWLPSVRALNDIGQSILRISAATLRLVVIRDAAAVKQNESLLNELKNDLAKAQKEYEGLISLDAERSLYERYKTAQNAYMTEQVKVMQFSAQDDIDSAIAVVSGELNQYDSEMAKLLIDLTHFNEKGATDAADLSGAVYENSLILVLVLIVAALLATTFLAIVLTRSIVRPLYEAVEVAQVIASGNLTQSFTVVGEDEPAQLLHALRSMQQSLRTTVQSISDSSTQLASASEELSAVTEDSTRGLHQQNNEIEQAATAVNQMTSAVEEVARNAVSTSEASQASNRTAQHGREQVRQTVDSISHLADDVTHTVSEVEQLAGQVRDISKVLDVIRSIAEQTNLLALNAAIEAARAGDAGRGFAVVADEVRALAHRTQQSTREIEQMISGIQQGTDKAVNAMQNSNSRARSTLDVAKVAGQALDEIAAAISQINERNLVIASASEEQAQVAREVDRNLVNIRDLSMQSSAGANQSSVASQELSRLAVALKSLVSRFNT